MKTKTERNVNALMLFFAFLLVVPAIITLYQMDFFAKMSAILGL